jgi:ankyrin repeat protein
MTDSWSDQLLGAVWFNDVSKVRLLTSMPQKVTEPGLLHYAARLGNSSIVFELLRAGWKEHINYYDEMSLTPLMWAAMENNFEVVALLLSFGAKINAFEESKIGNTAIREAAQAANPKMVEFLLKAGADPFIRGWMHLNAIDVAEQRVETENSEDSREILRILIEKQGRGEP